MRFFNSVTLIKKVLASQDLLLIIQVIMIFKQFLKGNRLYDCFDQIDDFNSKKLITELNITYIGFSHLYIIISPTEVIL